MRTFILKQDIVYDPNDESSKIKAGTVFFELGPTEPMFASNLRGEEVKLCTPITPSFVEANAEWFFDLSKLHSTLYRTSDQGEYFRVVYKLTLLCAQVVPLLQSIQDSDIDENV